VSGLRFAFLTTFYPPFNFGGDGIGIQRLARGLVRAGHHVTVIHDIDAYNLLRRGSEPAPETDPVGVEVIGLRSGLGVLSLLLTQQLGRPVVNAPGIRRLLDEGRYDVINFHNVSLIGGPGLYRYGNALKLHMAHEHWLVCPTHVLWRHGRERCDGKECLRCQLHYRRPPQWWRTTGYLEREARHVDAFIAMSEFSRRKHREFGFAREMEVLPYFLENRLEATEPVDEPPRPRPYFLFAGRLEKIKGVDDVIPLFGGGTETGPDLVIAGDGEYRSTLEAAARGMRRVVFLGRVPLEELGRYYRHALGLIVPSVCFETFGIIIIEAFRYGTPVLARAIGPFPELIERSGGGLLFGHPDELRAAMDRLAADPELRERLGQSGRRAFDTHWCERAVVPRYLEIVRRTAERVGRTEIAGSLVAASGPPIGLPAFMQGSTP
jgi:glycosyltransferase involved in cell wall biosynthesis